MRENFLGIGDLLERNVRIIDSTRNAQARLNRETREQATQQRAIYEYEIQRADAAERVERALKEQGSRTTELQARLREAGMLREGRVAVQKGDGGIEYVSVDEFNRRIKTEGQAGPLREQLERGLALSTTRAGQFSFGQIIQSLARGDIGGAFGELLQQVPGRYAERLTGAGERMEARWAERAGLRGLLGRIGIPTALAGFAASPAAFAVVADLGRRGLRSYQRAQIEAGQVGLAGAEATRELGARRLTAELTSLNPFDALTRAAAQEIARGITSEGFTGELRDAWQEAVGDVVIDTGMTAGQALEAMRFSVNTLGMSVDEFRDSMGALDQTAKDTNLSVATLQQGMQAFQQAAIAGGGPRAAAAAGQVGLALQAALPGMARRGELATVLTAGLPMLAPVFAGISPLEAQGRQAMRALPGILDNLVQMIRETQDAMGLRGQDETFAQIAIASGVFQQFLPGITAAGLIELMKQGRQPGGFRGQALLQSQREAESAAERARGREFRQVGRGLLPIRGQGLIDIGERRAFANTLARQLQAYGLSQEERLEILRPLYQRWQGTDIEFERAQEEAQRRLEVQVSLAPNAKGYFADPGAATAYLEYTRGQGGSQYTRRPPG